MWCNELGEPVHFDLILGSARARGAVMMGIPMRDSRDERLRAGPEQLLDGRVVADYLSERVAASCVHIVLEARPRSTGVERLKAVR